MLHHVSFGTNDVDQARRFYDPIMTHLGLRVLQARDGAVDYGISDILFSLERPSDGRTASAGNGVHLAFLAQNRAMVDEFHRIGLANGGRDAGAPGIREKYDAHYYGAFLYDPEGNKIEAFTMTAK